MRRALEWRTNRRRRRQWKVDLEPVAVSRMAGCQLMVEMIQGWRLQSAPGLPGSAATAEEHQDLWGRSCPAAHMNPFGSISDWIRLWANIIASMSGSYFRCSLEKDTHSLLKSSLLASFCNVMAPALYKMNRFWLDNNFYYIIVS